MFAPRPTHSWSLSTVRLRSSTSLERERTPLASSLHAFVFRSRFFFCFVALRLSTLYTTCGYVENGVICSKTETRIICFISSSFISTSIIGFRSSLSRPDFSLLILPCIRTLSLSLLHSFSRSLARSLAFSHTRIINNRFGKGRE